MKESTSKLKKNIIPFMILIVAAVSIYGLPYFKFTYWETFKSVYGLSEQQMNSLHPVYGFIGIFAYLIGGILADKISVKILLVISFVVTGAGGLYLLTIPPYSHLLIIHGLWAVTTLMTFWPAFIKAIRQLASEDEQSKAFGLMEGTRGILNIFLASIPLFIFGIYEKSGDLETGMLRVVLYYSSILIVSGIFVLIFLKDVKPDVQVDKEDDNDKEPFMRTLVNVVKKPSVWLIAMIVFCSYTMNLGYYHFTPYSENILLVSATTAGIITVLAQWIRPISSYTFGFVGNKVGAIYTVLFGFFLLLGGTLTLLIFPGTKIPFAFFVIILAIIYFGMWGVFANHYALLGDGQIKVKETGIAVGLIATIGYLPETLDGIIYGKIGAMYGNSAGEHTVESFKIFLMYLCIVFTVGIIVTLIFKKIYMKDKKASNSESIETEIEATI